MFRRFSRQARLAATLTPGQINALKQANQLITNGNTLEAAGIFSQLAQQMENTGHPRRAANFHAQAAHLYADGSNEAQTLAHAQAALRLFIQFQMVNRTPRFYANITQKMHNRGMAASAAQLEKEFGHLVGSIPSPIQTLGPQTHGRLPSSCPQCGAPVRSDEVDWIDNTSAECIFCGAVIQTVF
jgi:hypothetical protein